jgi:polygalacturonase
MLSVLLSANTVILASMLGLKTDLSAQTQAANTQAIQDVLDNLNKLGGGTLFFDQPGTYTVGPERCNTPGTPNYRVNSSLVVYSNTTIEGVNGVTLRRANKSNCYFLRNNLAGDLTSTIPTERAATRMRKVQPLAGLGSGGMTASGLTAWTS